MPTAKESLRQSPRCQLISTDKQTFCFFRDFELLAATVGQDALLCRLLSVASERQSKARNSKLANKLFSIALLLFAL